MAVHTARVGLTTSAAPARDVRAWDLPTRLFKWTLVTLVVFAYFTQRAGGDWLAWHFWNGYAILILVVFRIMWGFVGSSTARFSAWVTWPWQALAYAFDLIRGRTKHYLGHNPLGGWMIIALLVLILAQGVTGLWTGDSNDLYGGPFVSFSDATSTQKLFSRYHHWIYYFLLAFAAVHILANVFYQFFKNDPLIGAMIMGTKPAERFEDQQEMVSPPMIWIRAAICLAVAAALVLGTVRLAGGDLSGMPS